MVKVLVVRLVNITVVLGEMIWPMEWESSLGQTAKSQGANSKMENLLVMNEGPSSSNEREDEFF